MKTASLALAALAVMTTAAMAEQPRKDDPSLGRPTRVERSSNKTDYGADRRVKTGTDQTYNTGPTGADVGKDLSKDQPATLKDYGTAAAGSDAAAREPRARGTGVATGFVAAGIGLAVLGLFVRKRTHRYPYDDSDDEGGRRRGYDKEI